MLGWPFRWMERRRRRRVAVTAAVRHFAVVTGQQAHQNISSVIGEEAGELVVRICYGQVRPPGRAWFRVGADGQVRDELSFEEAGRFGERPWR